jgi:hypothetical protein
MNLMSSVGKVVYARRLDCGLLKILGLSFQEDPAFRCGFLMLALVHIG